MTEAFDPNYPTDTLRGDVDFELEQIQGHSAVGVTTTGGQYALARQMITKLRTGAVYPRVDELALQRWARAVAARVAI